MAVSFRDADGTTRLSGDLLASGGATGDVLTQQADGTYAPATGGGSQALQLLGPFTVNWDTPGVDGDGATLAEIASGTLLLAAWAEVLTAWNVSPAYLQISVVGNSDPTNWNTIFTFQVESVGFDASGARAFESNKSAGQEVVYGGAAYSEAGLLLAQTNETGASAGQARVYALVNVPT